MHCPKCNSQLYSTNDDNDMECLFCGYIEYKSSETNKPQAPPHPMIIIAEINKCLSRLSNKAKSSLTTEMNKCKIEATKPNSMSDPECLVIEKCDVEELRKLLDTWIEYLKPYEQYDYTKGIACGLLAFDDYLACLGKEVKSIFGEG